MPSFPQFNNESVSELLYNERGKLRNINTSQGQSHEIYFIIFILNIKGQYRVSLDPAEQYIFLKPVLARDFQIQRYITVHAVHAFKTTVVPACGNACLWVACNTASDVEKSTFSAILFKSSI